MDLKQQDPESCYAPTCSLCSPCDMEIPGRTVMILDAVLSTSCDTTSVMLIEPVLNPPTTCMLRVPSAAFMTTKPLFK